MSDDLTRFLAVLLWAALAWAALATARRIARAIRRARTVIDNAPHARAHLTEARRALDFVTWGECPRCGKDDCWCDRDGNGWLDLMDAARDHPRTVDHVTTCRACLADYEQEVTR